MLVVREDISFHICLPWLQLSRPQVLWHQEAVQLAYNQPLVGNTILQLAASLHGPTI